MRILIWLLPLIQITCTAPYLKLTPEEYKAFQVALQGKKPLFLQSALPIFALKNVQTDKFVILDIGGPSPDHGFKGQSFKRRSGPNRLSDPKFGHRLSTVSKNSVNGRTTFKQNGSPIFKQNGVRPSGRIVFLTGNSARKLAKDRFRPMRKRTLSTRRKDNILLPIYRDDVNDINPISKRRGRSSKQDNNVIRKKRDTDETKSDDYKGKEESEEVEEEEEPVKYVEELSFGLSTAGGVLGGTVGGYLDTTGTATLKLIRSLENLGLIALGQLDNFLDQQEKEKSRRSNY